MGSKYTPGPWQVFNMTDVYPVDDEKGWFYVADCWPDVKSGFKTKLSLDEAAANAKLIAASPDLLEAAQAAFNHFGNYNVQPDLHTKQVLDKLWMAIGKAQGFSNR